MTKLQFRLSLLVTSITSIGLRVIVPPNPYYISPHDDQLMINMARSIMDGHWVGKYSETGHLLLAKPPGFAIFIAWTHWLPWAPTVTVHLMLLGGFILVIRELRAFAMPRGFGALSYVFFAFVPIWFNENISRVYRDGLLSAVVCLILGSLLWLRRELETTKTIGHNSIREYAALVLPSLGVGLGTGAFVVIKPSWHFLLILMAVVLVSCIFPINHKIWKRVVDTKYAFAGLGIVIGTVLLPLFVMAQNQYHLGIFQIDSFSSGNFSDAMKAIYGVKDTENRPYIDVTKKMRSEIYKVSPTMAKLKDILELPDDNGWRSQPCHNGLAVCDESGAWFPWELRDAVENAGLGKTAVQFEATFGSIAREIRVGCQMKRIECESEGLAPGLDSLDSLSGRVVLDSIGSGIGFLLDPNSGKQTRGETVDIPKEIIATWEKTVRGLPPREFSTQYQSNDLFLSDLRESVASIYKAIWIPMGLLALIGLITKKRELFVNETRNLRFIGCALVSAIAVMILELSLLQASSGFYMTDGGSLYLLPIYPLFAVFIIVGLLRLSLTVSLFQSAGAITN